MLKGFLLLTPYLCLHYITKHDQLAKHLNDSGKYNWAHQMHGSAKECTRLHVIEKYDATIDADILYKDQRLIFYHDIFFIFVYIYTYRINGSLSAHLNKFVILSLGRSLSMAT